MTDVLHVLCALASLACAALVAARYRAKRTPLLVWSSICFAGLALYETLHLLDHFHVIEADLSLVRGVAGLLGLMALLHGLIVEPASETP